MNGMEGQQAKKESPIELEIRHLAAIFNELRGTVKALGIVLIPVCSQSEPVPDKEKRKQAEEPRVDSNSLLLRNLEQFSRDGAEQVGAINEIVSRLQL